MLENYGKSRKSQPDVSTRGSGNSLANESGFDFYQPAPVPMHQIFWRPILENFIVYAPCQIGLG